MNVLQGMRTELKELVGKKVQIYPSDSKYKSGIIEEITDNGVLFKITNGPEIDGWYVGALKFISYSANLSFTEEKQE